MLRNIEQRWSAIEYPGHLYGSVNGCLGLLVQVSPILFAFLKEIETRLANLIVPVGGFAHDTWRAFKGDREIRMAHNFVDGDLIETLLDLCPEDKAKLVKGLRIPVSNFSFFYFYEWYILFYHYFWLILNFIILYISIQPRRF